MLRAAIVDAAARGALVGASALLLHAGESECRRFGWAVGLCVAPLHGAARVDLASFLAYRAALSALGAMPGSTAALQAASTDWARLSAALLLAASCARMLAQYALAVAGAPSTLSSQSAHALHFMLGFDGIAPSTAC